MPSTVQHLTLDNGLQVVLRHAPQLKRCAAAVRVMAGSHDAPRCYAGLAHFLEHLLFLGTERFGLDDGLMRYVQRHGGQVNASTRERTTDYFFEVPQVAFAGGLERLCDMLARPLFEQPRQVRERDVIHAEFIAWSRNPQAQAQFALLQQVSREHPLSGFHAGNRYSLPVHSSDFQRALHGFHQRFYQAGQMTLSLSGPQPLEQLHALASRAAAAIASGVKIEQDAPPALANAPLKSVLKGQQLDLLHAIEQPPEGLDQALEYLTTWLTDPRPGGPLAALRQLDWLQSLESTVLYSFAGQALLHMRLKLSEGARHDQAEALLHDWMRFLRDTDRSTLNQEFACLQQRRGQVASALELACRDSAGKPYQALDAKAERALVALLDSLLQGRAPSPAVSWHLPAAEPLLNGHLANTSPCPAPAGVQVSPLLLPVRQHGVVYLRWHLAAAEHEPLGQVLERALQPLRERSTRAGATLQFDASGKFWQLRCAGVPEAVVKVTEEALALLHTPGDSCWMAGLARDPETMPIRALLRQLPEQLAGQQPGPLPSGTPTPHDLQATWRQARWQALTSGFTQPVQHALNRALQHVPGRAGVHPSVALAPVRRWQMLPPPSSEQALLLFCPVPAASEACARLMAQHIQGPFYQRLRVELQLGYAVFSAFRQLQGCSGLLFGVQSPSASHTQIITHIHELLATLPSSLSCIEEARQALAEQMSEASMNNDDVAEWAWQAQLAGRPQARLEHLQAAILAVDEAQLRQCADAMLQAKQGWLCLANGPAPQAGAWTSG